MLIEDGLAEDGLAEDGLAEDSLAEDGLAWYPGVHEPGNPAVGSIGSQSRQANNPPCTVDTSYLDLCPLLPKFTTVCATDPDPEGISSSCSGWRLIPSLRPQLLASAVSL